MPAQPVNYRRVSYLHRFHCVSHADPPVEQRFTPLRPPFRHVSAIGLRRGGPSTPRLPQSQQQGQGLRPRAASPADARRVSCFFDAESIGWGENWVKALERAIERVRDRAMYMLRGPKLASSSGLPVNPLNLQSASTPQVNFKSAVVQSTGDRLALARDEKRGSGPSLPCVPARPTTTLMALPMRCRSDARKFLTVIYSCGIHLKPECLDGLRSGSSLTSRVVLWASRMRREAVRQVSRSVRQTEFDLRPASNARSVRQPFLRRSCSC